MSDIDTSPLLQTRWADRQTELIKASLAADDFANTLLLIDLGFAKVILWDDFEFWLAFLWSSRFRALKGLGRHEEAAVAKTKAEEALARY